LFYVLDESRKYIKINLLRSFIKNTLELLIHVIQQFEKFYQVLESADFFSMCKNSVLEKCMKRRDYMHASALAPNSF